MIYRERGLKDVPKNKFECPKCGSKKLTLVLKVPRSTDGLMPKQQIFLKCEDCGYEIPIHGE